MSSVSRGRLVRAIVSGILILLFLFFILLATYLHFGSRARRRHAYSPTSFVIPGPNCYFSESFASGEYAILSDDGGVEGSKLTGDIVGGTTDVLLVERSPIQSGEEHGVLLRPTRGERRRRGGIEVMNEEFQRVNANENTLPVKPPSGSRSAYVPM